MCGRSSKDRGAVAAARSGAFMMQPVKHTTSTMQERQASRMRADREELADRIGLLLARDGSAEPQAGVIFNRASSPSDPLHGAMEPSFCVIAQGGKEISFGE